MVLHHTARLAGPPAARISLGGAKLGSAARRGIFVIPFFRRAIIRQAGGNPFCAKRLRLAFFVHPSVLAGGSVGPAHGENRRNPRGANGLWRGSFVIGAITLVVVCKSRRRIRLNPGAVRLLSFCMEVVAAQAVAGLARSTSKRAAREQAAVVLREPEPRASASGRGAGPLPHGGGSGSGWRVRPSITKEGPARGNFPGGGPLLIPEQSLQALPVPDRFITILCVTNRSPDFKPSFWTTFPGRREVQARGGLAFGPQRTTLRGEGGRRKGAIAVRARLPIGAGVIWCVCGNGKGGAIARY